MTLQTDKVKEEFAKRLHIAMDKKGYPIRGRARILSNEFKISDKGASKWLNGEAIPETSKIPLLAAFLSVNTEWLLSGVDDQNNLKTSENLINNQCLNKISILDSKLRLLLEKESLNEDQILIIEGMIDGINTTINTWIKPKTDKVK
ncbi:hypothetical protein R4643_12315 [Acinetobacter baumannii]|nr:hypothetical protein [Acinetobacter baumannii]